MKKRKNNTFIFSIALVGFVLLNSNLFASDWEAALNAHRKELDELTKNYGVGVKATHKAAVGLHYDVQYLDLVVAIEALSNQTQISILKTQSLNQDFIGLQLEQTDDPVAFIQKRNRGLTFAIDGREQINKADRLIEELDKVRGALISMCSDSARAWPESFYNPQTLYAPKYISLEGGVGVKMNFSVSAGVTVSEGNGRNSYAPNGEIRFRESGGLSEKQDNTNRGIAMTVGGIAGSYIPVIGTTAGMAIGVAIYETGKIIYSYFTGYFQDHEDYQALKDVIGEINKVLSDGTPSKEYSDQLIREACDAHFSPVTEETKKLSEKWEQLSLRLHDTQAKLKMAWETVEASQRIVEARVLALLDSNKQAFEAAEFAENAALQGEELFQHNRQWSQKTRDLDEKFLRTVAFENTETDRWKKLELDAQVEALLVKSDQLLSPLSKETFRTETNIQSRPLYQHRLDYLTKRKAENP